MGRAARRQRHLPRGQAMAAARREPRWREPGSHSFLLDVSIAACAGRPSPEDAPAGGTEPLPGRRPARPHPECGQPGWSRSATGLTAWMNTARGGSRQEARAVDYVTVTTARVSPLVKVSRVGRLVAGRFLLPARGWRVTGAIRLPARVAPVVGGLRCFRAVGGLTGATP